jgi:hypothetical protein
MSYPSLSTSVKFALTKSGFHKTPHFNTLTQTTAAGKGRSAIALMPYATWDFDVELVPTNPTVLKAFLGCYLATCAGGSFFYFTDPNDNTVADAEGIMLNVTSGAASPMGKTGDGASTQFQLARAIGQGVDVLQNVAVTHVKVNGSVVSASVSDTGVVTFGSAPPAEATLSWAGTFQYLCQFKDDTLADLAAVNKNSADGLLWTCASIAFESVLL